MRIVIAVTALLLSAVPFTACQTQHKVEMAPVEVKPIHITIDVNVKIDRALDDFFGDIDKAAETVEPPSEPKDQP